ncbi:MAG TPA: hypothetical protein VGL94_21740 [Ktedonobacteraceae bacterium]|jgi:hypothetical protein
MTDALLVKRLVRLSVSGVEIRPNVVIRKLTELSGLNVERGGLFSRKLYAYFDDVDSANAAADIIVGITYCRSKVHIGEFDVTNLVFSDNTRKLRNLRRQVQSSKKRPVKRSGIGIDTLKSTKNLQRAKNTKVHHIVN